MNWFILIAGIIALFTVIGHFTVGRSLFLLPMLKAEFDPVAKGVMHCVFHYVSVYLVLSAACLLLVGAGLLCLEHTLRLIWFIGGVYALMAIVQLMIAMSSSIEKVWSKMFQWVFFVLIVVFIILGST
jgi:hypothetical protein